jgi:hypothetical protein
VKDNKFPKCDKFDQAIKNYVLIGRIKKKWTKNKKIL